MTSINENAVRATIKAAEDYRPDNEPVDLGQAGLTQRDALLLVCDEVATNLGRVGANRASADWRMPGGSDGRPQRNTAKNYAEQRAVCLDELVELRD